MPVPFVAFLIILVSITAWCCLVLARDIPPEPGLLWKIPYHAVPELDAIYREFRRYCTPLPPVPQQYVEDAARSRVYQKMRLESWRLSNLSRWKTYETERMLQTEKDPAVDVGHFLDPKHYPMSAGFAVRLGLFKRKLPKGMQRFAEERMKELCQRMGIDPVYERPSDVRGSTYSPGKGFFEPHTNRHHIAGWRIYIHYLPGGNQSYFNYRHPFDGTVRHVQDSNLACNMFRIRPESSGLLWHSMWMEDPRLSMGLYVDPALAQKLKGLSGVQRM